MQKLSELKQEEIKVARYKLGLDTDDLNSNVDMDISSPVHSHEDLIETQRELQMNPVVRQEENYQLWLQQEMCLINETISTSFGGLSGVIEDWEVVPFLAKHGHDRVATHGTWRQLNARWHEAGMQLRSVAIRPKKEFTLRSIACSIKITFRLYGDSTLWIASRGRCFSDASAAIWKITKSQDVPRAFMSLGAPIGENGKFAFFKTQEVLGISDPDQQAIIEDYIEIQLHLFDNGDDKVWVEGIPLKKNHSQPMLCNKFIPQLEASHPMFAGCGTSVILRKIMV